MKRLLKTTSLFSLIAISGSAFAQSPMDPANFTPRLKIVGRYSLWDNYRANQNDLIASTARMGVLYRYKNVFSTLEFQAGSASDAYTSTSVASSSSTTNTSTSNGNQELFVVRRAFVGLDLYVSDPATVSFILGRDRFASSFIYAPDALNNVLSTNHDNVSSVSNSDGVGLRYKGKFDFGTIAFGLGSYNNIAMATQSTGSGWFANSTLAAGDNTFNTTPKSGSRAIQSYLTGDFPVGDGVVEAKLGFATQNSVITSTKTANSVTTYTSKDVVEVEGSLGYSYKDGAFRPGIWYQSLVLGRSYTSPIPSPVNNNLAYTGSPTDDGQTIKTMGVGFLGTSKLWGMTDLLSTGDALTYAFGYQNATGQLVAGGGGTTGVTSFSNQTLTDDIYNVGIGYMQEKLTLEFNYAMISANRQMYTGSDGIQNQSQASIFYLAGTLVL